MKLGMRKPSFKKSFKARTTGKLKRSVKKAIVPGYGKKGIGYVKNPKKAVYNKVYNKTTFGVNDILKYSTKNNSQYKNIKSSYNVPWNFMRQDFNKDPYDVIKAKNKKISIILIVIAVIFIFSGFSFIGDKDFDTAIFSFIVGIVAIILFGVLKNKLNLEIQNIKEMEKIKELELQEKLKQQGEAERKREIELQEKLKQQEEAERKRELELQEKLKQQEETERKRELELQEKLKQQKEAEILYKNQLKDKMINMFNHIEKIKPTINNNSDRKRNLVSTINEIKFTNITKRTNKHSVCDFVVIDTETTGIKISGNRIIEISALRFIDFEPVEYFSTLINPKISIPQEATNINHITDKMVQNAPEFYQIKDSLLQFIGQSTIIGHNLTFDLRHIYASGLDLTGFKKYDTYEIAKKKIKKENSYSYNYQEDTIINYKLSSLCDYFNIDTVNLHSSLYDCYYTGLVFKELVDMVVED